MAVTVDATVGGASSNSFVTVAEADAYLEARLNSAAWTGDTAKKQAVIEATRELNRLDWAGQRVDTTQALSWPRDEVEDPDSPTLGEYVDNTIVPLRVKEATYELALEFLRAGTTDLAALPATTGVIEKTVDVLTTRYADPSQQAQGLLRYPRVWTLISPYLANGGGYGQPRLVR